MKKRYAIPIGLIVVLLISWFAFGSDESESAAIYASPQTGSFKVTINTTGELRAKNSTLIRGPEGMRKFRVYQVKIQKMVPEGTLVKKGDFVANLDRSEISNKLKDAQLDLEEEQTEYKNAKLDSSLTLSDQRNSLVDLQYKLEEAKIAVEQSKYESPAEQRQVKSDRDQAERSLKQAHKKYKTQKQKSEANLKSIENDLQKARQDVSEIKKTMQQFMIRAPENGMVIYRRGRDGSKVGEGSTINVFDPVVAKLPDFSVMNSETYVNEVDIQKVKVGQEAKIGLDAMPEKKLTGRVTDVANIGEQRPNSDSKVFQVTIRLDQSDSTMRPSMTTSNKILVNSVDSALYVPLETVHNADSMDVVFKQENRHPVMQQVVLGMMNENDVVIKAGLSKDDKLYLSMPEDTTNIKRDTLPRKVLERYQKKKMKEDSSRESMPKRRKILPGMRQKRGADGGR